MSDSPRKFCLQCRHGRSVRGSRDPALYRCWYGQKPLADGEAINYGDGRSAYAMRQPDGGCGSDAKFFEPRETL